LPYVLLYSTKHAHPPASPKAVGMTHARLTTKT
jgi:hypothetical protein